VSTLFSAQTRHTVPLFQRPYVWTLEDQWEPLWEDVAGLLDRLDRRQGDEAVASHFMGTIVLEQTQNPTGSLLRREVIDGQQRLTTLQILLKAVEHALAAAKAQQPKDQESKSIDLSIKQIAMLTENVGDGIERYKVWPTNEDREPFQTVIDCTNGSDLESAPGRMAAAYRFFIKEASDYLDGDQLELRAQRLSAALKDYLKLIVLDLDPSDEPQAIFETLNAHGTPLLPADLMKNWLLWEAARQKLDPAPLYEEYWRVFDKGHDYWRQRVGAGHAARARVDTFLQNWLTKETGEAVSASHLYDRFLRHVSHQRDKLGAVDVPGLMRGIRDDAVRFEHIDKPTGVTRFDTFLERLKSMDIVVFHPLLLTLMAQFDDDGSELNAVAEVLESYLVRRMVGNYQTRGYGTLALRLLNKWNEQPAGTKPAAFLRDQLLAETGADIWPRDEEFRDVWCARRFYGSLRRERVAMLLRAIERRYQDQAVLTESLKDFDWSKLQVEHILPQSWQKHWPLAEGVDAADRDYKLHGIGNLTLVAERLNPTMSNAPWLASGKAVSKQGSLDKHSALQLNKRLLSDHDVWSDHQIPIRASALFEVAREIWPLPAQASG
jgi:hypothetical protein